MTVKSKRKIYGVHILLATVALLICVGEASKATDSKTLDAGPASRRTLDASLNDIQADRRLRATIGDGNYDSEDRGFTSITKIKDLGTKKLQNLAESTMTKLMSNNQPTTDKRFKQLITGQVGSNVLKSKQFDDWASSVTKAYKKNQEAADTAMLTTLTAHYGEKPLANMLAAAGGTKSTVTRLENAQLNKWKEEGKKADDVYRLLKIDEEGRNLLKSPKLQMWMNYMSKLDKDPYGFLLFKVKANYDDAGLAKMLVLAKNDPGTRAIARKLETLQLESWMKNDKTMIDAFQLLKLNEEGTTLLKSPVLTTWVSYVEMLKKDPYELLFLAIKKNGFDEVNLAKMIGAAKQDIHTGSIAAKMEDLQFKKWSKDGKSSEDLFKFLGLNKEGDELFDSPAWSIWASYLNRQELNPELAMFSILRTRFGDEGLTKMVTRAKEADSTKEVAEKLQLEIWRANGQTSDEIFNLLKLNKKGDQILESPALSTWVAYVQRLNQDGSNKFVHITQLEKRYGVEDLARMLVSSKSRHYASKPGIIDDLQEWQFKKWMVQMKDPRAVNAMFPFEDLASLQVKFEFKRFYKENVDTLII